MPLLPSFRKPTTDEPHDHALNGFLRRSRVFRLPGRIRQPEASKRRSIFSLPIRSGSKRMSMRMSMKPQISAPLAELPAEDIPDSEQDSPITSVFDDESRLTTPASIPDGGEFHLFPNLPIELRLKVWEMSLSPQLLPFILAGPTQQNPLDARSCRRYPWRHISSPLRKCPTLLHVNREARSVGVKWYTESRMRARVEWFELGDEEPASPTVETDSSDAEPAAPATPKHPPCLMEAVVARRNKHCYWRPTADIVWLSSAALPSTLPSTKYLRDMPAVDLCAVADTRPSERSRTCSTESAHCEFLFDRRVRYLAMDKQMWNIWIRSAMTVCSGLEVVWVVVDRETRLRNARAEAEVERQTRGGPSEVAVTAPAAAGGESSSSGTTEAGTSSDATRGTTIARKKKGFDDTHISSKSSTWERVEVRLVEDVEEIFKEVESWC